MRVLTFSRYFPSYHPKQGQPTFFAEKLMASFAEIITDYKIPNAFTDWDWYEYYNAKPKWHTIREGNRWKDGDMFSPRVWSGRPYCSKQVEIGPPITVKKTFEFKINEYGVYLINGDIYFHNKILAMNDGLSQYDMERWFRPKPDDTKIFEGQIICWNENINY